jgi:hypothetical protein
MPETGVDPYDPCGSGDLKSVFYSPSTCPNVLKSTIDIHLPQQRIPRLIQKDGEKVNSSQKSFQFL